MFWYKPCDRKDVVDEAFFRLLEEASQALVLMGDLNHNICWRDSTAGNTLSKRFLECINNNFLT